MTRIDISRQIRYRFTSELQAKIVLSKPQQRKKTFFLQSSVKVPIVQPEQRQIPLSPQLALNDGALQRLLVGIETEDAKNLGVCTVLYSIMIERNAVVLYGLLERWDALVATLLAPNIPPLRLRLL